MNIMKKRYIFAISLAVVFSFPSKIQAQCLVGESVVIFHEDFPFGSPTRTCGAATISPLAPGRGTTAYRYLSGCQLLEEEYAITNHSYWSSWDNRTRVYEHTRSIPGGSTTTGAMMINADLQYKYFYEQRLNGLCPNTLYELSAWYVSIAANDAPWGTAEEPSDIRFEIWDGTAAAAVTRIEWGDTGPFGGQYYANDPQRNSYVWRKKTILFTTNNSEYFWIKLKNNLNGQFGNDLMIDDIMVTKCVPVLYIYEKNTSNTSLSVCNDNTVNITVELSAAMADLISTGTGTVYAQLMSSTDQTNWTVFGEVKTQNGAGIITFTIPAPAIGSTVYYRVKLSTNSDRAANINLPLIDGCFNDVITQNFDVKRVGDEINANINKPLIVCGNEESVFSMLITPTDNPAGLFPTHYNLVFEPNDFFQNTSGTFNGGNTIEISIPSSVYPANYPFTLTLSSVSSECGGITFTDTLKVYYSNKIMEQKWDDVIALLNKNYNGDHTFTGYQWYRNNQIMQGEKNSYIYLASQKLNPADCYQVLVTRPDNTKVFSCCFYSGEPRPTTDNPIVIQSGGVIKVTPLPENSTVRLWTVTGILLQSQKINASDFEINVSQQGIYLLEIVTTENNTDGKVFKIVVK